MQQLSRCVLWAPHSKEEQLWALLLTRAFCCSFRSYCTTFMRALTSLLSSSCLSGLAFVVPCHFVYSCLPFSLVFSRLCCQLFPLGYSFVACLGFKWQAKDASLVFHGSHSDIVYGVS